MGTMLAFILELVVVFVMFLVATLGVGAGILVYKKVRHN